LNAFATFPFFGTNARTNRIVFFVCASDTAAICTNGIPTGSATHPPGAAGSKSFNRVGANNSSIDNTAAPGDFPCPFANRRTPC
jgi:hypothetical protein